MLLINVQADSEADVNGVHPRSKRIGTPTAIAASFVAIRVGVAYTDVCIVKRVWRLHDAMLDCPSRKTEMQTKGNFGELRSKASSV